MWTLTTAVGIKIFEIDFFFIYLTFDPSTGPQGAGQKSAAARHFHVISPHTKFGWILYNCLGGDSITNRHMDRHTKGQRQ